MRLKMPLQMMSSAGLDVAAALKVVSNVAVGYDNIDVAAATQGGNGR